MATENKENFIIRKIYSIKKTGQKIVSVSGLKIPTGSYVVIRPLEMGVDNELSKM